MSADRASLRMAGAAVADRSTDHSSPRWPHFANAVLGAWLASSGATYATQPIGLAVTDVVCGLLIIACSLVACEQRFRSLSWLVGLIGLWLMLARLVFWAPTAAGYAVSTLIGSLVFAFALLIPGMPGMIDTAGAEKPLGWTYNPSTWVQRSGIIALAFVQFFVARYLVLQR